MIIIFRVRVATIIAWPKYSTAPVAQILRINPKHPRSGQQRSLRKRRRFVDFLKKEMLRSSRGSHNISLAAGLVHDTNAREPVLAPQTVKHVSPGEHHVQYAVSIADGFAYYRQRLEYTLVLSYGDTTTDFFFRDQANNADLGVQWCTHSRSRKM